MIQLAHGVGGRTDLPVPFLLALFGAGGAVLFSFAALGVLWRTPRLTGDAAGRPLPRRVERVVDSPAVRWVLRAVALVVSGVVLAAAFAGSDNPGDNPAPWFLYITLWVGLVPLSLLFGPVWRVVNPLRTCHAAIAAVVPLRARALPERVGYWPAAAELLVFVWMELAYTEASSPRVVGAFLLVRTVVHLGAALRYGPEWFARGDGFEVYSTLVGHLAPLGRRADGRLVLRGPFNGLAAIRPAPGLVAVVTVLVGSTAFDGLTRSRPWNDATAETQAGALMLLSTAAVAVCVAVVAATYVGAARRAAPDGALPRATLPGAFIHSVVPIAVGYAIAHYFSLLIFEGQQSLILASDPFHQGSDWLGTAGWSLNFTLVSPTTVAVVQIGAVVAGHVVAVVAAHDRALALLPARDAVRGQLWLLAVMVAYTLIAVTLLLGG